MARQRAELDKDVDRCAPSVYQFEMKGLASVGRGTYSETQEERAETRDKGPIMAGPRKTVVISPVKIIKPNKRDLCSVGIIRLIAFNSGVYQNVSESSAGDLLLARPLPSPGFSSSCMFS